MTDTFNNKQLIYSLLTKDRSSYQKEYYRKNKNRILRRMYEHNETIRTDIRERVRKYREKNREEINRKHRELYHRRIEHEHERSRKKYLRFKDRIQVYRKTRSDIIKRFAIAYYSDGTYSCNCCGENMYGFLTIDHINNDGALHRKVEKRYTNVYHWLRNNLYPDGFQVLCYNCNCAKQFNRGCPHQIGGLIYMGSPSKIDSGVS